MFNIKIKISYIRDFYISKYIDSKAQIFYKLLIFLLFVKFFISIDKSK